MIKAYDLLMTVTGPSCSIGFHTFCRTIDCTAQLIAEYPDEVYGLSFCNDVYPKVADSSLNRRGKRCAAQAVSRAVERYSKLVLEVINERDLAPTLLGGRPYLPLRPCDLIYQLAKYCCEHDEVDLGISKLSHHLSL